MNPPKINVNPDPTPILTQDEERLTRVKDEQSRLRKCILSLRSQVKNPSIMDQFLSCLSTVTAIDGRLPFTPKRVVTVQDKLMLIHNLIAKAILDWGILARKEFPDGEPEPDSTNLHELERIVGVGFGNIFAYPKERNSAIYVLRTFAEEKELYAKNEAAKEKALEMKAHIRSGGLPVDEVDNK